MVFIRGPIIDRTGSGVDILAKHAGKPAIVQSGHILATTFHPELTSDTTVHQYFLKLAAEGKNGTRAKHSPETAATNGSRPAEARLDAAKSPLNGTNLKSAPAASAISKTKKRTATRKQIPARARSSK
jgi:SNO glutamine amidotransferase family